MVNVAAEGLFGYNRAELIGQSIDVLVPERFRRHHPDHRAHFFAEPQPRAMGIGLELYALHKNGSQFPVEIGLNPIKTELGVIVLATIIDISARKRSDERFRSVVEHAPNAMLMVSTAGLIEMVNAEAVRLFGYEREEMVGQPIEILVPERFRKNHPGLRGSFFADPKSRSMGVGRDLYALRKDGSEFPVEIGLNPIEAGGECFCAGCHHRHLSAQTIGGAGRRKSSRYQCPAGCHSRAVDPRPAVLRDRSCSSCPSSA